MSSTSGKDPSPLPAYDVIDAWRVFRILSELVEGFESMVSIGPSVSFFGSSKIREDNPYYKIAAELASKIAKKGFAVITGGGAGAMQAANQGARQEKGKSCGLCIDLPDEEEPNAFIDRKYLLRFRYFFVRKVMFVRYAQAFVVMPGGFGTIDELFEALMLIQTKRIKPFPVYLVGKDYWSGLIQWMNATAVKMGTITPEEMNLLIVTDDLDEIVSGIEAHYQKKKILENF
ncbi:MAG: TIGR00730 family Rossman fold protein [Chlamydiales bacterium]|nr:TIGR00730 family Rossman fold protein [Chlamydiales bacterium]